jgi:two-component system cell cycle sensor histidine kinase/response regulator CckA
MVIYGATPQPTTQPANSPHGMSTRAPISRRLATAIVLVESAMLVAGGLAIGAISPNDHRLALLFVYSLTSVLMLGLSLAALSLGLRQMVFRRLDNTTAALHDIGQGDLARRIPISEHDEVGQIQDGINRMAAALAERSRAAVDGTTRLVRSESNLAAILHAVGEAVIVLDADSRVVRLNLAALELLDTTEANALGRPFAELAELLDAEGRNRVSLPDPAHLTRDARQPQPQIQLKRHGVATPVSLRATPLSASDGSPGAVLVLSDLSRLMAAQERSHQAQKLQAVGQLAGGIAHDFNNLLTVIIGQSEMVAAESDIAAGPRDRVQRVLRAANRAADLTASLLAFSRKNPLPTTWIDLHDAVSDAVGLLEDELSDGITLELSLESERCRVKAQRSQVQNVVMNLCLNARDAMPEGGTLAITSRLVSIDREPHEGIPHRLQPGVYFELQVADTGSGIEPSLRERIFEPFFTTKEPGRGTGLGLASAYGTICDHGGTILLASTPGAGSTFHVLLPLHDETTGAHIVRHPSASIAGAKVLVIDDDPAVRQVLIGMLERLGHQVTEASSGEQGLAEIRDSRNAFDLVMIDLIMPGKDGYATLADIFAIKPNLRAITCSGYAKLDDVIPDQVQARILAHLVKPYRYREISDLLARTLTVA